MFITRFSHNKELVVYTYEIYDPGVISDCIRLADLSKSLTFNVLRIE